LDYLTPERSLRNSRTATAKQMLAASLGVGPGAGAGFTIWSTPHDGVIIGLGLGLVGAIVFGVDSAWGRFVLARAWLAARGHLPARLMHFLNDARHHGVLRQSGPVHQFRHARLQNRLQTTTHHTQAAPWARPEEH
jgi:hypothetical protein